MILPGRVPAFKDPNLKLLPSGLPKSKVHRSFHKSAEESDVHAVSYCTFCQVWKKYRCNVRVQNPRTDLCSVCTTNQISLGAMTKLSKDEQLKLLQSSTNHLVHANKEREEYKRQISESRANVNSSLKMGCHEPCSLMASATTHLIMQNKCIYQRMLIRLEHCIFNTLQGGYFRSTVRYCFKTNKLSDSRISCH